MLIWPFTGHISFCNSGTDNNRNTIKTKFIFQCLESYNIMQFDYELSELIFPLPNQVVCSGPVSDLLGYS